jgi:hypothetical protein
MDIALTTNWKPFGQNSSFFIYYECSKYIIITVDIQQLVLLWNLMSEHSGGFYLWKYFAANVLFGWNAVIESFQMMLVYITIVNNNITYKYTYHFLNNTNNVTIYFNIENSSANSAHVIIVHVIQIIFSMLTKQK